MPERVLIAAATKTYTASQYLAQQWRRGGPLVPLVVKALLFAVALLYVQQEIFSVWSLFVLLLVAVVSYMQPVFKTFTFSTSFFLLVSLSILLTSRFTITLPVALHASFLGQLLFAVAFGFLFFVLLGIKNVVFVRRQQWYSILFIAMVLGISLLFFTSAGGVHPWRDTLLFMLFTYLLLREYFRAQEYAASRGLVVIALTFTAILVEAAWAISVLPLGFSKSASLLTLLGMMGASSIDRYIHGTLTGRFIRTNIVLLLVLIGILFGSVRWTI